MRYIYEGDADDDEPRGPTIINDESESLVDTIAAALMRGDTEYAYLRAQRFYSKAHAAGAEAARKSARDYEEEENRRNAEFGHGKVEFRTRDGLRAIDKLTLGRYDYYQRIWKRACKTETRGLMDESTPFSTIPVRTYEFRGERTDRGVPVYEEMAE
jgi:hypothetical protein